LLSVDRWDVTSRDNEKLASVLQGCTSVIYAASASKRGGSAAEVDNLGVTRAAAACLAAGVARYVVISSTATTRPKSLGYVFTNLSVGGNIMGEKRNGETGTMVAYDQPASKSSYTIVRPGGLEEPKRNKVLGPSVLEISQGDVLSGIISRADVAEVTVELALSDSPSLRNTALELYYKDSVVAVEGKFKPLLGDESSNERLRLHGSTYSELFRDVRSGVDFAS
jgi:nucleoside-diphosphate-sugar epimerase